MEGEAHAWIAPEGQSTSREEVPALFISPTPALNPLLQSQGIPHMRELTRHGYRFTLLSYEEDGWGEEEHERARNLKQKLNSWGIEWRPVWMVPVPWRPRSMYEIFRGAALALAIIRERKIQVVHCRSYLPAYMMLIINRFTSVKWIFDMRGFLPEEYLENHIWEPGSFTYRLSKVMEKVALKAANAVVVTSPGMRRILLSYPWLKERPGPIERKLTVIPNYADTRVFHPNREKRQEMRERFGLSNNRVFLWLVGGITEPHMPGEVVRFILAARQRIPDARLLVLTGTPNGGEILVRAGLPEEAFLVLKAPPEQVADYIAMGDAGMNFCDPAHPGSAVKIFEYLGCGLPLVINWAVEEAESLTCGGRTGVIVRAFTEDAYLEASGQIEELMSRRETVSQDCTQLARDNYSLDIAVQRFLGIYRSLVG